MDGLVIGIIAGVIIIIIIVVIIIIFVCQRRSRNATLRDLESPILDQDEKVQEEDKENLMIKIK